MPAKSIAYLLHLKSCLEQEGGAHFNLHQVHMYEASQIAKLVVQVEEHQVWFLMTRINWLQLKVSSTRYQNSNRRGDNKTEKKMNAPKALS